MMGWYGHGMDGFGWVGWMGMGVFWLVLIGLVVWLVARAVPDRSTPAAPPAPPAAPTAPPAAPPASPDALAPALAILDRRLAAGEIDVETYRATRAALTEGRG